MSDRTEQPIEPQTSGRNVRVLRPVQDFLATETASGVVLIIAATLALIWANSPLKDSYADLWSIAASVTVGGHSLSLDLRHWVNEGLMTFFFFVVGLEIKREITEGELREPKRAALPMIAALGGMLFPAVIYLAFNSSGDASSGWGIPMATDIAIALGVLSLLGARVPLALKTFLLALAIADDVGAIVVIAVFYSDHGVDLGLLGLGACLVLIAPVLRRFGVTWVPVYLALAIASWLAVYAGGIHATLAGVAMGLLIPSRPIQNPEYVDAESLTDLSGYEAAKETVVVARQSVSSVEWLLHQMHPWVSFGILPLFALANAGIPMTAESLGDAVTSPVTLGVATGLIVGKIVGITLFSWLALRFRLGMMPTGVTLRQIAAVATIAGIGFTVSIFITDLAFEDARLVADAKIGVLAASLVASVIGLLWLRKETSPRNS